MSGDIAALVSGNLDVWTAATERKSGAGRGSSKKIGLYGIERLRALIIDVAVQGKLVPQEAADEPASSALKRIAIARRAKIEAGRARKPRAIADLPSALPALRRGWAWTQLGIVAEIGPGNQADDETEVSFVPMTLVSTSISGEHEAEARRWADVKKGFTQFAEGDIGLAKITPCFENGKAAIFQNLHNGIGAGTTELHVARPWSDDINRRYLLLTMKTASYLAKGEAQMTGTAGQKRVTRAYFETTPLPLPPLAEQQRIVAKVDELMALCDALEAQSASALEAHQALVETLLATLVNTTDAADLARQWARLETHFDTLFTTDASIEALKRTILDLAVWGTLVPQDPKDEPASGLLKRIAKLRQMVLDRRRKTTSKTGKSTAVDSLPNGWQIVPLEELANPQAGFAFKSKDFNERGIGLPLIRIRDVGQPFTGTFFSGEFRDEFVVNEGDYLISMDGEFRVATWRGSDALLNQRVSRLQFYGDEVSRAFVAIALQMELTKLQGVKAYTTVDHLSGKQIASALIPVPPLAEQQRIIAKVDELMALCDALKARLTDAAETQKHLADAIVERAAA